MPISYDVVQTLLLFCIESVAVRLFVVPMIDHVGGLEPFVGEKGEMMKLRKWLILECRQVMPRPVPNLVRPCYYIYVPRLR